MQTLRVYLPCIYPFYSLRAAANGRLGALLPFVTSKNEIAGETIRENRIVIDQDLERDPRYASVGHQDQKRGCSNSGFVFGDSGWSV